MRFSTPGLAKMLSGRFLTVVSWMPGMMPISGLFLPCTTRERISASRGVRTSAACSSSGVPAAERGALFTGFARLSNRPVGGEESTGIGLSVVKRLIGGEKGAVGADFPAGGGSVFWFELPVAPGS